MKRMLVMACMLLAFFVPASAAYEPLGVTQEEREEINWFLSNFSEQGMHFFNRARAEDAQMIEFGVRHIRLNRRDLIEYGSAGEGMRISMQHVIERVQRYLGCTPLAQTSSYQGAEDGYVYFSEGSDLRMGFVCMSAAEDAGEGRVGVYFGVYASGEDWNAEDFGLRPEQAARKYPSSQVGCGYAVIDLGEGTLQDRSAWTLVLYDTLL